MDYKIQPDESIININNILLEEIELCIKDFLKRSLIIVGKNNMNNIYLRLLFNINESKYINQNFVYNFPKIKSNNIFYKLLKSIEELFDVVLSINIIDNNYKKHLDLIILINYIKRLIYERRNDNSCEIIIPDKMPCFIKTKRHKNIIKNFELNFGIINLLEKVKWIKIVDKQHFDVNEKINYNKSFVLSLKKLLNKLEDIYDNMCKMEKIIIGMFSLNDIELGELLGIEPNDKYFIKWKECLGLNNYKKINEIKSMDLLRSNYEQYILYYDEENENYNKKLIEEYVVDSKKKVIYEGII